MSTTKTFTSLTDNNLSVYAAYYDNYIRMQSSSGGVFTALAEEIISSGGVVYGVTMSNDCYSAEFIRIDNADNLNLIRGSKYIQANIDDTFQSVKIDLENDLLVLFSGTGCQVDGLKCFLRKNYNNLICVDVVCHGTPSEKLWREYLKFIEKQYGKITKVNFRYKINESWKSFGMKENEVIVPKYDDPYMLLFLNNYSLRPSCYNCRAKFYKMADITIADLWGISKIAPEIYDKKGANLVIIRSIKGSNLFNRIKQRLITKKITYEEGVKYNSPEYKSVQKPQNRESFYADLNNIGFEQLLPKYLTRFRTIGKIKNKINRIVDAICGGGDK